MLKNFSNRALKSIFLPIWVVTGFLAASLTVSLVIGLLEVFGLSFDLVNQSLLNAILTGLVYVLSIAIVLGLPRLLKRLDISRKDLGLDRLVSWLDIFITPVGLVIYFLISAILLNTADSFLPWVDINQTQELGFDNLTWRYEYLLAFVALVIVAPVAEEVLFRGYLYGKLKKYAPIWVSILITSVVFGAVHGAWNVGIDTFALSIVLCLLREATGGLWAPILLHMAKNGIAYYFLFINPVV